MARRQRHALCGLLFAAACTAGCGSQLPLEDDFAGSCDWSQDEDDDVQEGCTEGQYRIFFKSTAHYASTHATLRLDEPVSSIGLEADVSVLAAPKASPEDPAATGLTCEADPNARSEQRCVFYVALQPQSFGIEKIDKANRRSRTLAHGFLPSEAIFGIGGTSRMRAECGRDGEQVKLTMLLDGREIKEVTDPDGFPGLIGFGFTAISPKAASSDFRYDNFAAEELD
jgi:hypothetical protein